MNIQNPQEIAAVQEPRRRAARQCAGIATRHKKREDIYRVMWRWAGRIAQLGFATGIGMLMWFAIANVNLASPAGETHKPPQVWVSYSEKYGDDSQKKDHKLFAEERLGRRISQNKNCIALTHNRQMADYVVEISVERGVDLYTGGGPQERIFGTASLSIAKQNGEVVLVDSFYQNLKSREDIGQQPLTELWDALCQDKH